MRIVVTGVAGFMGNAFVRWVIGLTRGKTPIMGVDALTYAGNLDNVNDLLQYTDYNSFAFAEGRIGDRDLMKSVLQEGDIVVNFAAETHVDRAIFDSREFIKTNIEETKRLIDVSIECKVGRFVQISTDEVVGEYPEGFADERVPFNIGNDYAASKLAAEGFVMAAGKTRGLPWNITRSGNNYGPRQYPEKAVPVWIDAMLHERPIPLYGDGKNERCWVHVEDHARAVWQVITTCPAGQIYNIATGVPVSNREIVEELLLICGKPASLIEYVRDRPGHDRRYALDARKLYDRQYRPRFALTQGLRQTVAWYRENQAWIAAIKRDPRYIVHMEEVRAFRERRK